MTGHPMLDDGLPGVDTLAGIFRATGATGLADSLQAAEDVQVEPGPHRRQIGAGYRPDDITVGVARASWTGAAGRRHHVVIVQTVRVCRGEDCAVFVDQHIYSRDLGPAETDAAVTLGLAGMLTPQSTAFEL